MMRLFLRYMTMINLFIFTCRSFGLFLVKVTPELYLFFMMYLQNGVLATIFAQPVILYRLLYYVGKNEINENMIANFEKCLL